MNRISLRQSGTFLSAKLSSFFFVFCVLGLVACGYVGLRLFWADSEMWPVSAARNFNFLDIRSYLFVKPLFNFLLWVFYKLALWIDQVPWDVARVFMALNLAAIIFLVFRIVKKITDNELLGLMCAIFLLFTITILEQGTRIRSDLLVCSFVLLTLDLILRKGPEDFRVWIPAFLSLLISPKAIYWILALAPFFPSIKVMFRGTHKYVIFALIIAVFGGLFIYFPTVVGITKYFLLSFTSSGSGMSYFDPHRFEHVVNAIQKDYLFWALVALRLLWVRSFKNFDAIFVILFAILLFHPERMPFFIVSLMPFFIVLIFSHPRFSFYFKKMQTNGGWIFLIALVVVSSLLFYRFSSRSIFLLEKHNNTMQRQAVHQVQDYLLKEPSVSIYDPAGIIYKVPAYDWFVGPSDEDSNLRAMSELKRVKPDIILYSLRMKWLEPEISELLKSDYITLGGGVFGRFPTIPLPEKNKVLRPADVISALPEGKVVDDPKKPVRIFVFNKQNQDISSDGYWLLEPNLKLDLMQDISFQMLQTKVVKVVLPASTNSIHVSLWNTFYYTLPEPVYMLFRFDPEL